MEIMNGRAKKTLNLVFSEYLSEDKSFLNMLMRCGPLWSFVLLISLSGVLHAQTPTLTCNPAPINAPKEIAINQNCQGVIIPAIIAKKMN